MKKILALLIATALALSFGMAFSVTGEFFSKFALDNDTWLKLDFETFQFRYSFDNIAPAPEDYMSGAVLGDPIVTITTNPGVDGAGNFAPKVTTNTTAGTNVNAWTAQNLGRYEFTGFKVSDTVTLGVKLGATAYGYKSATALTNGNLTNNFDIGWLGLDIEPQFKIQLADNMSVSEKDLVIQYWSMNHKSGGSSLLTNDVGADNALPKIGFGAQLSYDLSDQINLNPALSFTITERDGHNIDQGPLASYTNTFKRGLNTLKVYGFTTLSSDMYKFKVEPYLQMDMLNTAEFTSNSVTNNVTGSTVKLVAFLGDGKRITNANGSFNYGDNDSKFDTGDDKKLRNFTVSDQLTIQPYFGFETIVMGNYVQIVGNSSGSATNNYSLNELFFAIGANDVKYKIDDTYSIDLQGLYVIDNSGVINNSSAANGTNNLQTNITTYSFGGNLNIQIAPNAVIHAGTTFSGYTIVYDTKNQGFGGSTPVTNVITINHSALADPTLELGGEVMVGDFAVKGVIKSQLLLSSASDSTNLAPAGPTAAQGGTVATSTQGLGTAFGDMQITYTKDNGHFKLKFLVPAGSTTTPAGAKEATPVVAAEVGYKF